MKFEHSVIIHCLCPRCCEAHDVEVDFEDYTNYIMGGTNIQDAFPYLSANQREYILSGFCEDCWNHLFAEEEDEEEENDFFVLFPDKDEEEEDFDDSADETGFNPYSGCYDFDC